MNSTVWETPKRSAGGAGISMNIPPRTLLYSLEPIGLRTPFVDSFTSNGMHLAAEQSLSINQLAAVALSGKLNPPDDVVEFFWSTHVLDGVRSLRLRHAASRCALNASQVAKRCTGTMKFRRAYPTSPSTFPLSLTFAGRPNLSANR